jgi:hypothetical protein
MWIEHGQSLAVTDPWDDGRRVRLTLGPLLVLDVDRSHLVGGGGSRGTDQII